MQANLRLTVVHNLWSLRSFQTELLLRLNIDGMSWSRFHFIFYVIKNNPSSIKVFSKIRVGKWTCLRELRINYKLKKNLKQVSYHSSIAGSSHNAAT